MFGVRIHGRGGQGVVTAAELLSVAVFAEDGYAQAFPSFGSERTGAPVEAYCRIDDQPIRAREPIVAPDAVVIADPTLVHQIDLLAGLRPEGYVLVNTMRPVAELGLIYDGPPERLRAVPATDLALQHVGRPYPNAALLGGFAALTGRVGIDAVLAAIAQRFPSRIAAGNQAAARAAYEQVRAARQEATGHDASLHLATSNGAAVVGNGAAVVSDAAARADHARTPGAPATVARKDVTHA